MNGPKQKLVSVDEASISTLSVEIKTISVGRRQMSMALFRQLPQESLIDLDDADMRFNGMPWGRVNYHWDGCYRAPQQHAEIAAGNRYEHVHVLWQRDSMLLQSPIPKVPSIIFDHDRCTNDWHAALSRHCQLGALVCTLASDAEIKVTRERGDVRIHVGRWSAPDDYNSTLFEMMRSFRNAPADSSWRQQSRIRIGQKITELCDILGVDLDFGIDLQDAASEVGADVETEAWDAFRCACDEADRAIGVEQQRLALYGKRYQELLALEQLFISA